METKVEVLLPARSPRPREAEVAPRAEARKKAHEEKRRRADELKEEVRVYFV